MTYAWSLRETDLYMYQRQLNQIDESRVDGNFVDATGQPADLHAQRVSQFSNSLDVSNILKEKSFRRFFI